MRGDCTLQHDLAQSPAPAAIVVKPRKVWLHRGHGIACLVELLIDDLQSVLLSPTNLHNILKNSASRKPSLYPLQCVKSTAVIWWSCHLEQCVHLNACRTHQPQRDMQSLSSCSMTALLVLLLSQVLALISFHVPGFPSVSPPLYALPLQCLSPICFSQGLADFPSRLSHTQGFSGSQHCSVKQNQEAYTVKHNGPFAKDKCSEFLGPLPMITSIRDWMRCCFHKIIC